MFKKQKEAMEIIEWNLKMSILAKSIGDINPKRKEELYDLSDKLIDDSLKTIAKFKKVISYFKV